MPCKHGIVNKRAEKRRVTWPRSKPWNNAHPIQRGEKHNKLGAQGRNSMDESSKSNKHTPCKPSLVVVQRGMGSLAPWPCGWAVCLRGDNTKSISDPRCASGPALAPQRPAASPATRRHLQPPPPCKPLAPLHRPVTQPSSHKFPLLLFGEQYPSHASLSSWCSSFENASWRSLPFGLANVAPCGVAPSSISPCGSARPGVRATRARAILVLDMLRSCPSALSDETGSEIFVRRVLLSDYVWPSRTLGAGA